LGRAVSGGFGGVGGIAVKLSVTGAFFDAKSVTDAVDRAKKTVLHRIGQYVRKVAKNLIRTRMRPSRPGEPPTNQTGLLKQFVLYDVDMIREEVVIGPKKLEVRSSDAIDQTGPQLLEFGGRVIVSEISGRRGWRILSRAGERVVTGRGMRVRHRIGYVKARPYMAPALERSRPYLPKAWADSVRGG
jgi:hypothetical protein